VVATNEELATMPTDVEELTEEQYLQEKANMQSANQQPSQNEVLAQTVADLTLQNADLNNQMQTLSQTIATMQLN
jgi:cell division protein FtsB